MYKSKTLIRNFNHFALVNRFLSTSTNATSSKKLFSLTSRKILKLSGIDVIPYLQGLVTNDVTVLPKLKCMYSMLLNKNGRILHDVMLYFVKENEVLMETDGETLNNLQKLLSLYKLRKNVTIALEDNIQVCHGNVDGLNLLKSHDVTPIISSIDPRTQLLGYRMLLNQDLTGLSFDNIDCYQEDRYQLGVPEGAQELPYGKCLPLEYNLDYMNGVSFHKGCYVGQELTARTRFTGVIRKRVFPVILQKNSLKSGDKLLTEDNKRAGKLCTHFTQNGYGLASIKLEYMKQELKNKDGGSLKCIIPEWWACNDGSEFSDGVCSQAT